MRIAVTFAFVVRSRCTTARCVRLYAIKSLFWRCCWWWRFSSFLILWSEGSKGRERKTWGILWMNEWWCMAWVRYDGPFFLHQQKRDNSAPWGLHEVTTLFLIWKEIKKRVSKNMLLKRFPPLHRIRFQFLWIAFNVVFLSFPRQAASLPKGQSVLAMSNWVFYCIDQRSFIWPSTLFLYQAHCSVHTQTLVVLMALDYKRKNGLIFSAVATQTAFVSPL